MKRLLILVLSLRLVVFLAAGCKSSATGATASSTSATSASTSSTSGGPDRRSDSVPGSGFGVREDQIRHARCSGLRCFPSLHLQALPGRNGPVRSTRAARSVHQGCPSRAIQQARDPAGGRSGAEQPGAMQARPVPAADRQRDRASRRRQAQGRRRLRDRRRTERDLASGVRCLQPGSEHRRGPERATALRRARRLRPEIYPFRIASARASRWRTAGSRPAIAWSAGQHAAPRQPVHPRSWRSRCLAEKDELQPCSRPLPQDRGDDLLEEVEGLLVVPDGCAVALGLGADHDRAQERSALARRREVSLDRVNARNGYRSREWDTRAGRIELAIPKLRPGRTSRHSRSTAAGPSGVVNHVCSDGSEAAYSR